MPQHEFDLYDRIVDTVLSNRYPEYSSQQAKARSRLCVIAHGMHTGEELQEPRDQPRAEATVDEIDRMLKHYQANRPGSEIEKMSARDAREELLSQSGLLLPQGDSQRAAFYHFTCQDFLAAQRLYDLQGNQVTDVFQKRGQFEEWRKALGLLNRQYIVLRTGGRVLTGTLIKRSKDSIVLRVAKQEFTIPRNEIEVLRSN